jgi:hypothetical protein
MAGRLQCWNDAGSQDLASIPLAERYPQERPATNLIEVALGRAANGSDAAIAQLTVETLDAAYRSANADGVPVDIPEISRRRTT